MANMQTHSTGRYTFLRALRTKQLEQLLKADYSASMSEDAAEEFIDAVTEVMLEKEKDDPSGRLADVDKAWADFQTYYNVPDRDGQLLYPDLVSPDPAPSKKAPARRPKRVLRPVALIAAAIGVFMSLLVVAQAAGLDVFGAMARWPEETLHFAPAGEDQETRPIRTLLEEQNIPTAYAPAWIPAGFVAEEPHAFHTKQLTVASVRYSNGKDAFGYSVTRHLSKGTIEASNYEKKYGDAAAYSNGKMVFYIFENTDTTTAVWTDGESFEIEIRGALSVNDVKKIIDSIGGSI